MEIWGDSCEIEGMEVIRLAIRLINVDISVQSTLSVFCVAGRSVLFQIP